mmetsp:Transcript_110339/g.343998  ORF Transcript_110339/g.343998 Transcript_110339/m.343998 type:complete len:304 (-) Transcript_110339:109-1020(-)
MVEGDRGDDRGSAGPEGRGGRAAAAMVHSGEALRQQPLVGQAGAPENVILGVGLQLRRVRCVREGVLVHVGVAPQDDAAIARQLQGADGRGRQHGHGHLGDSHDGTPPDVHRRRARCQKGLQLAPRRRAEEVGVAAIAEEAFLVLRGEDPVARCPEAPGGARRRPVAPALGHLLAEAEQHRPGPDALGGGLGGETAEALHLEVGVEHGLLGLHGHPTILRVRRLGPEAVLDGSATQPLLGHPSQARVREAEEQEVRREGLDVFVHVADRHAAVGLQAQALDHGQVPVVLAPGQEQPHRHSQLQ